MQNFTIRLTLTALALFALCLPPRVGASPGFDLDLKELKKPSAPPSVSKKAVVTTPQKKQAAAVRQPSVQAKKPQVQTTPAPKTTQAVVPVVVAPTSVEPSELTLVGGNPCQLSERVAVAVARSVPAGQLLFGLNIKPVAAVQYNNLAVLITCGLEPAEAYTYGRLLDEHQVQLINSTGRESTEQVARSIVDALALSYQLEPGNVSSGQEGKLIYLFPADQERKRPLRLILQP